MESTTKDLPRRALGRGLAALIPGSAAPAASSSAPTGLRVLPVERLIGNKTQPRKTFEPQALEELANSIRTQGILQPIVVRRLGDKYEIVAGERRWRAAQKAGLLEVPVLIKEFTDSVALQVALIENVQRQDLDPLEEAEAYGRLVDEHKLTHDQLAEAVGKSRVAITNCLRLLKLPKGALEMLADGRITAGHARALMMLPDEGKLMRLAEEIVGRKLSVREAEARAKLMANPPKRQRGEDKPDGSHAERAVVERLEQALGSKVRLEQRNGKGHLQIHFHSLEELDSILDRILVA